MTGIPFLGQSTNTEYQAFLIDELNSVLNFGIGYNFVFSDVFNGYLSYSTDFSAAVGNIHDNNSFISHRYASTFNADINHFGGGVVMKFKRADITIGATLATTKYTIDSSLGFPVEGGIGIYDNTSKTDIRWNRWRFIVGISIPFLTDWTKKMENKILNKEAKKEE